MIVTPDETPDLSDYQEGFLMGVISKIGCRGEPVCVAEKGNVDDDPERESWVVAETVVDEKPTLKDLRDLEIGYISWDDTCLHVQVWDEENTNYEIKIYWTTEESGQDE